MLGKSNWVKHRELQELTAANLIGGDDAEPRQTLAAENGNLQDFLRINLSLSCLDPVTLLGLLCWRPE